MDVATAKKPAADPKHNLQAARQAYYDKISKYDMAPLWEVLQGPRHHGAEDRSASRRCGSSPTSRS